jgi:hypothetical protein
VNGASSDSSMILRSETSTYHGGSLPDEELVGISVLHVFYEPDQEAVQRKITLCFEQYCLAMSWEASVVLIHGSSGGQS